MAENESAHACVDGGGRTEANEMQEKQIDLPALTILATLCVFDDENNYR